MVEFVIGFVVVVKVFFCKKQFVLWEDVDGQFILDMFGFLFELEQLVVIFELELEFLQVEIGVFEMVVFIVLKLELLQEMLNILEGVVFIMVESFVDCYDLGYGYMGNGLIVWNCLEEEYGDYKIVVYIVFDCIVIFYDVDMLEEIREKI